MAVQIPFTGGSAALSAVPEAYQPQALQNLQQQRMAQLLMQQGQQQPQGQMISGRFVAPSPFQNLASVANQALGMYAGYQADKGQLELAKAIREGDRSAMADYFQTKEGRPAVEGGLYGPDGKLTMQTTADMIGPQGEILPSYRNVAPVSAIAPNAKAAYANLFADPRASAKLQEFAFTKMNEGPMKVGVDDVLLDKDTLKPIYQGAGKQPDSIRYAIAVGQLPANPATWNSQQAAYAKQLVESKGAAGAINLGQKGLDNTLKLRSDFRSEPVYKGFQEVESAFGQINKGLDAKSPAGDLASATKFMKLLDPTSVVRESELAMAMQATGALDKLYNYANLISTGQKLTPSQREDFRSLAKDFYSTAYDQYNTKRGEYVGIAERNKLNIEDVVGKEPKAPIKMLSAQDQEALNWARKNPTDPRSKQINQRLGQ